MPQVPVYQQTESLRPNLRQGIDVQASPDDFGAATGRGLASLGQGLSNLGDAIAAVRSKENETRAKDADNARRDAVRQALYDPESGFMFQEGKNAVDAFPGFQKRIEELRKEYGKGLTGEAAQLYKQASGAGSDAALQTGMIHTGSAKKQWFKNASESRIDTFQQDAIAAYGDPKEVNKNLHAGVVELRNRAADEGWDDDTLKNKALDFVSTTRRNVLMRIANDDPIQAEKYFNEHKDQFTGQDQYAVEIALKEGLIVEKSKREADRIMGGGRASEPSAPATPASTSQSGRTVGSTGPTKTRAFLLSRAPGKGASAVDLLDDSFATNLSALIQDAPPDIRDGLQIMSGARTHERQKELFANSDKSGRMVARPGHSNHEVRSDGTAKAVDLMWNGKTIKPGNVPQAVLDYVHQNAGKYGMYFPMSWEAWHIEPLGTRGTSPGATVAPRIGGVSARASAPSYDEMEARLAEIKDPDVRDATRKRLNSMMEAQSKAQQAIQKQAEMQLFSTVEQGGTPDDLPLETRVLAGQASMASAWSYHEAKIKRGEPQTDQDLLYELRRMAATDPNGFAEKNLMEYRDRLDNAAFKELTGNQTSALSDSVKAVQTGSVYADAYKQSESALEGVGLTTVGKKDSDRQEMASRIAKFQNTLHAKIDEFRQANNDRVPNYAETQQMINQMLLPIVIQREKSMWNPTKTPWSQFTGSDAFAFEARYRPDGTRVEIKVDYTDIPIELRTGIARDLETDLGRKPTPDEIVERYEEFVIGQ